MEDEQPYLEFLRFPPPIYPTDDPSSPPPESILLDPYGYLSERTNHTTAEGFTRDRKRIRVTFWAAHPPRVSCFTVHCPDLPPSEFGGAPAILSTEDDLVLLRVPICFVSRSATTSGNYYFVYQAGTSTKPPSLKLIPAPPLRYFCDRDTALLRCRDRDMYFVALLTSTLEDGQYNLHLYNSKKKEWHTRSMRLRSPKKRPYTVTSKAITIGGKLGSVGWVDLGKGILIADLLHRDSDHLRYVPLPAPLVPGSLDAAPCLVRDIIAIKGYIYFIEMRTRRRPVDGWLASKMRIKDSWKNWESECKIEVSEELVSDQSSTQLPINPEMGEPVEKPSPVNDQSSTQLLLNPEKGKPVVKPTLKGRFSGYPALSLHEADVVYIMDRQDLRDGKARVIAVDMRKCTLKGVADFGSGRPLGICITTWIQSGISKHLDVCSTSRYVGNDAETNGNGIAQAGTHAAETNRNGIAQAGTDAAKTSRKGCKHNKKGKGRKA